MWGEGKVRDIQNVLNDIDIVSEDNAQLIRQISDFNLVHPQFDSFLSIIDLFDCLYAYKKLCSLKGKSIHYFFIFILMRLKCRYIIGILESSKDKKNNSITDSDIMKEIRVWFCFVFSAYFQVQFESNYGLVASGHEMTIFQRTFCEQ